MLKSIKSEQGVYLIAMFTVSILQTSLVFTTEMDHSIFTAFCEELETKKKSLLRTFTKILLHLKEIKFNDYMIRRSFLNGKKEVILSVMFV